MSVLAWLFGLGALAVAAPFVFHLIRQTPRGRTEFSSLMFLRPTPPRLTQKNRLDNILLLLLRAAVLILIAAAFMRPFLRTRANQETVMAEGRDLLILIDTSASMQRNGIWEESRKVLQAALDDCETTDRMAFASFSDAFRLRVPFPGPDVNLAAQQSAILESFEQLVPDNHATELGTALASAADLLETRLLEQGARTKPQIVLITDQQQTPSLVDLQEFNWPELVQTDLRLVEPTSHSNSAITNLSFVEGNSAEMQVRIVNARRSKTENLTLFFQADTDAQRSESAIPVQVASGQTLSVPVPRPGESLIQAIDLAGDDDEFDNRYFFTPPVQDKWRMVYFGSDQPDEPGSTAFYLKNAVLDGPGRQVEMIAQFPEEGVDPELAVVTRPLNRDDSDRLQSFLERGGTVILVLNNRDLVANTRAWNGVAEISEVESQPEYALLVDIDFQHPMFRIFSAPGMNDFTSIRFWDRLRIGLDDQQESTLIARFDDRSPAIWETRVGNGRTVSLAAGWHPDESQFATSSKFPVVINEALEWAAARPVFPRSYLVGDSIPLAGEGWTIFPPDGSSRKLPTGQTEFNQTGTPGIYRLVSATESRTVAVNLAPAESNDQVYAREDIAAFGLPLGMHESASAETEALRRQADLEIESRQKFWKWLIVAAIVFLMAETLLSGLTRPRTQIANPTTAES